MSWLSRLSRFSGVMELYNYYILTLQRVLFNQITKKVQNDNSDRGSSTILITWDRDFDFPKLSLLLLFFKSKVNYSSVALPESIEIMFRKNNKVVVFQTIRTRQFNVNLLRSGYDDIKQGQLRQSNRTISNLSNIYFNFFFISLLTSFSFELWVFLRLLIYFWTKRENMRSWKFTTRELTYSSIQIHRNSLV